MYFKIVESNGISLRVYNHFDRSIHESRGTRVFDEHLMTRHLHSQAIIQEVLSIGYRHIVYSLTRRTTEE